MLTDMTGKEFKSGVFVAMSQAGKATLELAYVINVTNHKVQCLSLDKTEMYMQQWFDTKHKYYNYSHKRYHTFNDWLGKSYKEPTSLVIIEPPRLFILKYMKIFKQLDIQMPSEWIKDAES